MEEEVKQVNVKLPLSLMAMLDEMVQEDDSDNSKFIRNLIRQEYERRNPRSRKTNPRMRTVASAAPVAA